MNEEVLFYYGILAGGFVLITLSVLIFFFLRHDSEARIKHYVGTLLMLLCGVGLIVYTVPSLKYVFFQDYVTIKGTCTVEYDDQSKPRTIDLYYDETGDYFSFLDRAELGAYGPDVPYTCHVTATKDHAFPIAYRIYDVKTDRLLYSSE
ncbi:hypothetical protein [Exiguobacterium oxidotolerans]|uniref:Uncharacterized protein n=1 Tax=Exiguobacterium oxidotolerans TaxID=223958 RepID=A0A653IIB0_9BACL|nr:hypothetical protein [Exiguobacterium oxidotolerans]VWX38669.1 conserved hypothetical protein [Exiguobacterium oxidotolerans]